MAAPKFLAAPVVTGFPDTPFRETAFIVAVGFGGYVIAPIIDFCAGDYRSGVMGLAIQPTVVQQVQPIGWADGEAVETLSERSANVRQRNVQQ